MMTTMSVPNFVNVPSAEPQPGEYPLEALPVARQAVDSGDYNSVADDYYDANQHATCANLRAASRVVIDEWLSSLAFENSRIVEVGAGDSLAAEWLQRHGDQPAQLLITDASPGMLRHSFPWQKRGTRLRVARAESLPVAAGSIDVVVSSLGDPYNHRPFWLEMNRILSESGIVLFTMPSRVWAERYRLSEGLGSMESALFRWGEGFLALPSLIPHEGALRCLIASCGLEVRQVVEVPLSRIPHAEQSPKLQCVLDEEEPVVTGYVVARSPQPGTSLPRSSTSTPDAAWQKDSRVLAV